MFKFFSKICEHMKLRAEANERKQLEYEARIREINLAYRRFVMPR